jgi:hypothetical protein
LTPLVSVVSLQIVQAQVLLMHPLLLVDVGVEVVEPALAALLADAARQLLRDVRPLDFTDSVSLDQRRHHVVLVRLPGTLLQPGLQNFVPAMETLDIGEGVAELARDSLPLLWTLLVDEIPQLLIL